MTPLAPPLHPLAAGMPSSPAALALQMLPLALALGAPLALAVLLRRRALRQLAREPDAAWFGFARLAQWVVVAGWLAWFTALTPNPLMRLLVPALTPLGAPLAIATMALLCAIPPALLSLGIQALVHDVRRRAQATQLTFREALRAAAWQMAAMLMPVALVIVGVMALSRRQAALGLLGLIAALISRLWLMRRALASLGVVPQAVTSGPLRDRIFELAARARVKLQQLYVMPMARVQGANAFAVSNGTIMLTDVLLAQLSEREVLAVMAHEVAHLKHKHPQRIAQTGMFTLIFPLIVFETFAFLRLTPFILAVVVPVTCSLFATLVMRRRFEYEADATAIDLGGDPEALITGLVRISTLNRVPLHWGRWAERSLTHPSTRRRIARIAERAKLAPERVEALLAAPPADEPHFEFPRALEAGRLFTTNWKVRTSMQLSLAMIVIQTGVPALVVRAMDALAPPLGTHWGAILAATAVAFLVSLIAVNLLSVAPARSLESRMAARLAERGVRTDDVHATFVGLSPGREPRVYEHSGDWDLGFVSLMGGRLSYFGEETSFTLERGSVQELQMGEGLPHWIRAPRVIVSWRHASGDLHHFSLRPARVRSLAAVGDATRALLAELRRWQEGAPAAPQSALAPAGDPPTGEVTSISPRELASAKTLPRAAVMVLLFTGTASAALGLPVTLRTPGMLDALLVAALVQMFQRAPLWLPRPRRRAEEPRESLERAA
jgi:Zn-dependent protease with chaperone function